MKPKDYRTMLSGLRRANRKPVEPRTNFEEKPPAQKQMRALQVMKMLCEEPRTLQSMADQLKVDVRTIYRYCALIVDLGGVLEPDENHKYHLESCPLCRK